MQWLTMYVNMRAKGLQPNKSEHYGYVVDLLERAGLLQEAYDFMEPYLKSRPNHAGRYVQVCWCVQRGGIMLL